MPTTLASSTGADRAPFPSLAARRLTAWQAAGALRQIGDLVVSGEGVFWLSHEPTLGYAVLDGLREGVRLAGAVEPAAIRSRVNGYGGGALCAGASGLFAVSETQQILRVMPDGSDVTELTREGSGHFGGLVTDDTRSRVLAVREYEGAQSLVAIDDTGQIRTLHLGNDFYSAPAVSADGQRLAWVSWQLPDMPWVESVLWTADVTPDGELANPRCWPSPTQGCIQQPVFEGDQLWVLSDHDGWWQPYRFSERLGQGLWHKDTTVELDHGNAPWQLGERHHCLFAQDGWARVRYHRGVGELWLNHSELLAPVRVAEDWTDFRALRYCEGHLYCIARSATVMDAVLRIDPLTGHIEVLAGGDAPWDDVAPVLPEWFQLPGGDEAVQGFLYTPRDDEEQSWPLILIAHGGPTSAVYPVLNPQIQFWCQRGFAVAEVNYRGSTGAGRVFRMALKGQWGVADVEDMERAADYLAAYGNIDGRRIFIQGRSSGGYTALMALVRSDRFAGGASLYGVSDPMRLRSVTHRFESGYLDWLLGAPGSTGQHWDERTPRYRAANISAPCIFFQGGQDRVVVPEQTRAMVAAIREAGGSPELFWFEDEGHGFRRQENQAAMLEWLHSFYRKHIRKPNEPTENLS
ncbi:S9 family peptidase [Marinobacter salinexigens]|uniref:S9 family peptidase n=1 Tax=Marinobacter salinexigens TaxID=2919747 RepID=UPI001FE41F5E|nr:prolyl oligopeptidase family serine peptidase [Marinobacter salinexigens]